MNKKDSDSPRFDLIELFFFAYRDFTGDPDVLLDELGFGRAHHRVLHFVHRNPGIRVSDLLDILKITKQSLGRVLKQLVDEDFICQEPGALDRRQRLLYTTEKGTEFCAQLSKLQSQRINKAISLMPDGSDEIVRQFLYLMIDENDRSEVARLIGKQTD
ncbi:transcriptional regulator protein, MarR family [Pseudovibrio sp. FO-BEG1]|uniref:DNA-binding transcriptional regulator, MarR family n=1 Tax=Pseudovibrio denitrificans TaxID=258256 RepID=A0A1I6ZA25_9HYPH|nr:MULTISPECIES: MarR family transcriptional regulator [Pseudovibrio]AEV38925.1 transcriptional regulator protein, MarR family [Pseudovibrio sp. FO-BEG1]EEA96101.1 transcriptional regulatory protein, MarR family [Pseudovibrio sp. JE062]SFT59552.1 DNA-binding transcriptional regulator, MarR family [Pseudovibrio denitrificans]